MNLRPVSSRRMNAVGWEDDTMYIRFNNGAIYVYFNVSESEYMQFISSPSLGKALDTFQRMHSYRRIS